MIYDLMISKTLEGTEENEPFSYGGKHFSKMRMQCESMWYMYFKRAEVYRLS